MQIWYKGKNYPVTIINNTINSYKVSFNFEEFVISTPQKGVLSTFVNSRSNNLKITEAIEKWYRRQAKKELTVKSIFYAGKLGVDFNRVSVKDTKTRWGSCSSKTNLNYNYHLIKMPEQVLDYVVVHEVCHLQELNHSKKYWELVRGLCPEYKTYVKWLKENGKDFVGNKVEV